MSDLEAAMLGGGSVFTLIILLIAAVKASLENTTVWHELWLGAKHLTQFVWEFVRVFRIRS